jgi:hypothetical protein
MAVSNHLSLSLVCINQCGLGVPIQLTTDKGSEVGDMIRCHERLR